WPAGGCGRKTASAAPAGPRGRRVDAGAGRGSRQAAATPPDRGRVPPSPLEHRHGANRRAGAPAPFERQADEAEFSLADQRLEVAQAFDVRDVELEACLVHERVDGAHRAWAHGVDAEMNDPLAR